METITVLSPHCDDASFSLGVALRSWSAASIKLQVLNFFTQSAYAPHSSAQTVGEISTAREEEDRKALAFIHSGIQVISLNLLDAPLRLRLPFSQITQEESSLRITPQELSDLSQTIQQHCTGSLVVAPLGLGNHVDHLAVLRAACNSLAPAVLAFYEDLPYATWTSSSDLQARLEWIEGMRGTPLEPFLVQSQDAVQQKRQLAGFYQSQITAEEADNIARHAKIYDNGERIWTPVNSQSWKVIRSLATEPQQTATPHRPR